MASREAGVETFFFSSSACVYAEDKQRTTELDDGLREEDAYPAMPEDGYGWEKLFSERMCRHFREDFGMHTRSRGTTTSTARTAPGMAAARRRRPRSAARSSEAKLSGNHEIEIWGDGEQTRSFTYIDDCLEGTQRMMHSDVTEPLNVGSDQMVTINELVDIVEKIAGVKLKRKYDLDAPKGVRGRNSNNTQIKRAAELGAEHPARGRHGKDIRVDPRRDREGRRVRGVLGKSPGESPMAGRVTTTLSGFTGDLPTGGRHVSASGSRAGVDHRERAGQDQHHSCCYYPQYSRRDYANSLPKHFGRAQRPDPLRA